MGLFALDIVLWLLGIRGHIPRFDDVRPVPAAPVTGPGNVMRALAAQTARSTRIPFRRKLPAPSSTRLAA